MSPDQNSNSESSQTPEEYAFSKFVADIKDFRKEIDASIQRAERYLEAEEHMPSKLLAKREMSLVLANLQEANIWAREILELAGNPFPADLADKADAR